MPLEKIRIAKDELAMELFDIINEKVQKFQEEHGVHVEHIDTHFSSWFDKKRVTVLNQVIVKLENI